MPRTPKYIQHFAHDLQTEITRCGVPLTVNIQHNGGSSWSVQLLRPDGTFYENMASNHQTRVEFLKALPVGCTLAMLDLATAFFTIGREDGYEAGSDEGYDAGKRAEQYDRGIFG